MRDGSLATRVYASCVLSLWAPRLYNYLQNPSATLICYLVVIYSCYIVNQ